jgi:hypothetical protein
MDCQYCKKECKNPNSLRNHQRLCKENPDRQLIKNNLEEYNKRRKGLGLTGSNQYTKAKQEGRIISMKGETREKLSAVWKGKKMSDEQKTKISKSMQRAVRENPESYSASNVNGRVKKVFYKGILLDSKWELEFAEWCDSQSIQWEKNKEGFEYEWKGKRIYYPDFYLPDLGRFVEVKGYEREKDSAKWKSVPDLIIVKVGEIKKIRQGSYKLK